MRLAVVAVLFMFASKAFAQDSLTVEMLVPDKAIKVSPLHLLNFYPTIEGSYEQKVLPGMTVQVELGYVINSLHREDAEFSNMRGVKTKLEGRYYFWGRTDRRKLYYVSLEPYMNIIHFDRHSSRYECFDLECNYRYIQEYDYKVKYREQGFSLKAGILKYLFKSELFIDINSGITLRSIQYIKPGFITDGFDDEVTFLDIPNEKTRITVSPNLGMRLGYRFR